MPRRGSKAESLPKSFILRSQAEFSILLNGAHSDSGKILKRGCFTFYLMGDGAPRLGIAVSRKVYKRAVDRNRVKRVIREWYRKNKKNLRGAILARMTRRGDSLQTASISTALDHLLTHFKGSDL